MQTWKVRGLTALILLGVGAMSQPGWSMLAPLLSAVTLSRNTNPPAYIKEVVAYKEGDGLVIYLTMADASGALTRGAGFLEVTIREDGQPVWATSVGVSPEHFQTATVGLGAFERTTLLYTLGRIRQQDLLLAQPSRAAISRSHHLTIEVTFPTQGRQLKGTQDVWL